MTKVRINPGICGLITEVTAETEDQMEVTVQVRSDCKSVSGMFEVLGNNFDAFEICLKRPGENIFYRYAAENFPGHASCPVIAGIAKCIEKECGLALRQDAEIRFV